jgi:hypothetical protein
MKLRCLLVGNVVTGSMLTERPLPRFVSGHQARCLRCQAHGASVRTTRRVLAGMATKHEVPPPDLEAAVLGTALVAGAASGGKTWLPAAAGAVVVLVAAWAWRRREARA